jgi:hypothetical protein
LHTGVYVGRDKRNDAIGLKGENFGQNRLMDNENFDSAYVRAISFSGIRCWSNSFIHLGYGNDGSGNFRSDHAPLS